jgi:hypothetical protein
MNHSVAHTPGPWWVDDSDERRVQSNDGEVALVHKDGDARLIASAPELRDRLVQAAAWIADSTSYIEGDEFPFLESIRAALLQAGVEPWWPPKAET